jgi:hypothetical protein
MSTALKAELVPALREFGFVGAFPHFSRESQLRLQLVSVLYHQSGGQFLLEFGALPSSLNLEEIPLADRLAHVALGARARLQTESGRWFNFARYGSDDGAYRTLARSVSAALPQVDEWFHSGSCGPNVHSLAL